MIFLREIRFSNKPYSKTYNNLLAFKGLRTLEFKKDVVFFVGENGSGKSTLMEAVAHLCNYNVLGGSRNNPVQSNKIDSDLHKSMTLSWARKPKSGFFLRAENLFNYATYLDGLYEEMVEINSPEQFNVYKSYGGKSLHEQSHGESFLSLIGNRFSYPGLYLLDEPEAALSPKRQLTFLCYLNLYCQGSQFIIATHSPIIMAFPNSQILNFDEAPIIECEYENTDHYQITRRFLDNPEKYLKYLFSEVSEVEDE